MIAARRLALLVPLLLLTCHAPADAARKVKAHKTKAAPVASVPAACSDFYDHANEAWLKANPAPPSGSVSALDTLRANARAQERTLLEDMAKNPSDDASRALGTLWNDGMNTAAIDAAGATPLQPLLERIGKLKKPRDVAAAIADLHAAGIPVLFNFAADADLKTPAQRIAYATQGGLGLPDPAYYTRSDSETRDLLGRYRAYIQTILQLTGTPADQVSTQSGWVLSMEMELAKTSVTMDQAGAADANYRPTPVAELRKAYPALALDKFVAAQRVSVPSVSLAQTGFFGTANGMLDNVPIEQWQAYLRFHVASAMAPFLSKPFQDAHFQMYGRLLAGAAQPTDRAQQVQDTADRTLGATLGHAYAQRYLTPATRDAATRIADALRGALKDATDHNTFMDAPTRAAAQSKLGKLRIEIGEPKTTPSLAGLKLGGGYAADVLALAAWRHAREMDSIGKPDDGSRWPVHPQVPTATYDLLHNRIVVTAAALQAPVLDAGMDAARQFGAFGSLLGHQLQYVVAGKGRGIDADGQLHDWWSPATSAAWEQRVAPIVAQFSGYVVADTTHVDGARTRDENLADLGGVELAWAAFAASTAGKPPTATAERDFFDAYGKVWARSSAAASLTAWAASAVQAPAKYRVNGVLANIPAFAKAYSCKVGQPMELAAPVTVWK